MILFINSPVFGQTSNFTEILIENINIHETEIDIKKNELTTNENIQFSIEGVDNGTAINIKILQELIPTSLLDWVLLISGIFSTILVIFVGIQTISTRKEISDRLRPWIRIFDPIYNLQGFVTFKNNKTVSWSEYWENREIMDKDVDFITMNMKAVNGGSNPSTKTTLISYSTEKKMEKSDLKKNYFYKSITSPLMPNENREWVFNIPRQLYVNSFKTPFYIGSEISYNVKNKVYKIGKIWKMTGTRYETIEYWFDEKSLFHVLKSKLLKIISKIKK